MKKFVRMELFLVSTTKSWYCGESSRPTLSIAVIQHCVAKELSIAAGGNPHIVHVGRRAVEIYNGS